MLRPLSYATRTLAVAATFALPTLALAQADRRPVVVVFTFGNNSIGAGRADFEGITTGVQDLLITDLAGNAKIRLVDRSKINEIMQEHNLVKNKEVDPSTAIQLGKILGAQYAITGGFMADGKGSAVLTGRTIDIETTAINPKTQRIQGKSDDVLGMITQLSSKVSGDLDLTPKAGRRADAGEVKGDAPSKSGAKGDAPSKSATQSGAASPSKTTPAAPAASATTDAVPYAKPLSKPDALKSTKLDAATMRIYTSALEAMDSKDKAKAKTLFQQVLTKAPTFEPAQRYLAAL